MKITDARPDLTGHGVVFDKKRTVWCTPKILECPDELSCVPELLDIVVKAFLNRVQNDDYFQLKLHLMGVRVLIKEGEQYDGRMCLDGTGATDSGNRDIMLLSLTTSSSHKQIAFVIAHELAHLLFAHPNAPYAISGSAKDASINHSAVTRFMNDDEQEDGNLYEYYYGQGLEEFIANYVASYVIKDLDLDGDEDERDLLIKYDARLIGKLESCFGKPLAECACLNEIKEDSEEHKAANNFWDCVLTYRMDCIVDSYDDAMGHAGAFRELCNKIDLLYDLLPHLNLEDCAYSADLLLDSILRSIDVWRIRKMDEQLGYIEL